jgi:IS605 OrfB family transposase
MLEKQRKKKKKEKEDKLFHCQQNLLHDFQIDNKSSLFDLLTFICSEANKLSNCVIYYARQLWFKSWKKIGKFDLEEYLKDNPHFPVLFSQAAQQTLRTVYESFKSYYELLFLFNTGELDFRPKPPNYLKKGGLAVITYPAQKLQLVDGKIRIPLGNTINRWFGLKAFQIDMPTNLDFKQLKEIRIVPRNRCFYVEFVYPAAKQVISLDKTHALGLDPGVSNWLTCVSTRGESFIVDGKKLKSLNQWYNKQIASLKTGLPQGFWSNKLAAITEKRNRQMRDAINKTARLIVDYCLTNNLGTVGFGWNKENKKKINIGKQNNQNFVLIPTARLKNRIKQLCDEYGIEFVETEESYTSKSSFLDNDILPTYGEKSNEEDYTFVGKRVFRGLFRTAQKFFVNADCNGAANILRKVAATLGLNLEGVSRGALTTPLRVHFWAA